VCVYAKDNLNAIPIQCSNPSEEEIWVTFKTPNHTWSVGCFYRSPNTSDDINNHKLLSSIAEQTSIADKLIITGDFNLPQIQWEDGIGICMTESRIGASTEESFIKCLEENFLTQHVDQPTRYRENQAANTLDLIITNMDTNITSIKYLSPLGKSDHITLEFEVEADAVQGSNRTNTPRKNWNKGEYQKIRDNLDTLD